MKQKRLAASFAAALLTIGISACDRDGPAERAGEKIDRAGEKTGDKMERAADKAGDKMERAGEKIQDAARDAKN